MDETSFRAIVEQLPLVVYVDALDDRSTPIYVSPQIERLLGYTAAEWEADPDLYIRSLHPDDRGPVLAEIARRNSRGEVSTYLDYRLHARDGSVVWVRDEEVIVHDANGVPVHAQGYLQDVTERRHESMRLELLVGVLATATAGIGADAATRAAVDSLGRCFSDVRVTYATISGRTMSTLHSSSGGPDKLFDGDLSDGYGETLRAGHTIAVLDVHSDSRVLDPAWLEERAILAYVDAPVRSGDELLGVLCFDSSRPRLWSKHEVRTFTEVADQLAVILSDARARAEREHAEAELRRRDAILSAVSTGATRLLAALEWRTAAPDLLASLGEAVGASRAYLFENDVAAGGGIVTSQRFEWTALGIEPELENELMQDMSFAAVGLERFERLGSSDQVFAGIVSGFPERERLLFEAQGVRSIMTVPIFVGGCWWGFIGFDDCEHERAWSPAEIEGLRLAVSLVAAAIERERSDQNLHEHEHKLRAVFESAQDAIFVLDDERRFVDANPAASELLGRSKRDLLGLPLDDFLPPDRRLVAGEIWEKLRRDDPAIRDRAIVRSDGTIREVEGILRPDVLRGLHVAFIRDITERKRLEAELLGAQKLESVGRLAGGVAHDFNNLLTAISGYASLLHEDAPAGTALAHDLGEILRASARAAELTRQLLAFGRRQVLQPRPVDLNQVLAETGSLLRRLLGEHVGLELRPAEKLGAVLVDPGQIEQVIVNLAVNARDAMPNGGHLTITTRELELESGAVVELEVADTGIGMDEATREQIFEPFFTTREAGSGLGLASVHGIVNQSGGEVTVESVPGAGSAFRIRLPRVARTPLPSAAPAIEPVARSGSETILLVEDEDVVRALAQRVLERFGYTVLACSDGPEAIAVAGRNDQHIDLLLTDVVMPGLRGHEVAARVAASRPEIKVLYMSGYADETLLGIAAIDAKALIEKPFAVDALVRRVREALERAA